MNAFNIALETYDGDESRAFAVAHSAAKKADEKD
jgi:cation transport regulator